jgi:DNA-binding NarL/FixJ family response regulator
MPNNVNAAASTAPVVIADRRVLMRDCLACWLGNFDFLPLVTSDAAQVIVQQAASPPRLVMLSAQSNGEGRAWLRAQVTAVRDVNDCVPIIMVTDEADAVADQEFALSLELHGFIPMTTTLKIATAALRLVIAGDRYFPNYNLQPALTISDRTASKSRSSAEFDLTPREHSVCELLTHGLPNKLIARELGMALSTVKIHVHHILEKLGVQNRTEVAFRIGVVARSDRTRVSERRMPVQMAANSVY